MDENRAPVAARASTSLTVQSQISTWNPSSSIRRTRSATGSSRNTISAHTASSIAAGSCDASPPLVMPIPSHTRQARAVALPGHRRPYPDLEAGPAPEVAGGAADQDLVPSRVDDPLPRRLVEGGQVIPLQPQGHL